MLLLPISSTEGISFIDALFTATSATCVTGLIVKDTLKFFTPFGKTVILTLFQLGGLGIMTFSTIFALMLGHRITIKDRHLLNTVFENVEIDIKVLLKWIIIVTFSIETLGVIFLKLKWQNLNIFYAIFHAVSAFCNAGFSLFSSSFQEMRSDTLIISVISFLIITGGLGFIVLYDIGRYCKAKIFKKEVHPSIHTKIVLSLTLTLIILGMVFLYLSEKGALFSNYSTREKILACYFQSVTARTAGFNTIEIDKLTSRSKLFLILLMFIGASPGGTGGGIKTVTFGLVILGVIALLRAKGQIQIFRRAISWQLFEKAIVIFILSISWILFATLLLLFIEDKAPLKILFEVTSAFGTVGLSCNITSDLTSFSKFIIILTMFFGRIGPLTLATALTWREEAEYKLPEGRVMVG